MILANLAGQKRNYLAVQMEAFRSGERKSPDLVQPAVEKLTDSNIRDLARYFTNLDPSAGPTVVPD